MFTRVGMWSLWLSVFRRNLGHCFSLPLHPSANAVLHTQIPCSCPLESPPHLLLDPRVKTCHLSIEILSTHHVPESVDCSRFLNKSQSSQVCGDLSFLNNKSQSSSCKKKLRPFLLEDNGWCPSQKSRIMVPGDLWGKKFWNPRDTPRDIPGIVWMREDLKVPLKDFGLRVALTKPTTYPDAIQSGSVGFRI